MKQNRPSASFLAGKEMCQIILHVNKPAKPVVNGVKQLENEYREYKIVKYVKMKEFQ